MGINMDHPDRPVCPHRPQDRVGYRMIAANRHRNNPLGHDFCHEFFDICMALRQIKPALHRYITNISHGHFMRRRAGQCIVKWANSFNCPQGPRAKASAVAVCDPQIHRHPKQGHMQIANIKGCGVNRAVWCIQ